MAIRNIIYVPALKIVIVKYDDKQAEAKFSFGGDNFSWTRILHLFLGETHRIAYDVI